MSRGPSPAYSLHETIDPAALARRFAEEGRVRIAPFIREDDAARLAESLMSRHDWKRVMNSGGRVFESPVAEAAQMSAEQRQRLDEAVYAAAREGFQYRYESLRVPDEEQIRRELNDPLAQFASFMSSEVVTSLLRDVTCESDIAFADAQATIYRSGDFLTAHDDEVEGKHRRAAYVLGLTSRWRAEWGGLLLFHNEGTGDLSQALIPAFNGLTVFAVPQTHSVSMVTPFAGGTRLSVTGWLRARR